MIRTLADMLNDFVQKEKTILDEIKIDHGPTIGDMYEGLTIEALSTALPMGVNLEIGAGFVTDGHGNNSHEVDCIISLAEGKELPRTGKSIYHVKDVVAVFEVKKTIDPTEFDDSFEKMRRIREITQSWIDHDKPTFIANHPMIERAYRGIRFKNPPSKLAQGDIESYIFSILQMERIIPARIIIGYDGWLKESTLRQNLFKFLQGKSLGYGVGSFPNLIISGKNSLIKLNGLPYMLTEPSEEWPFVTSTHCNPILPLLEIIWTKLSLSHKVGQFWGDDLMVESMTPCLWGKLLCDGTRFGWEYRYSDFKERDISPLSPYRKWEPLEITHEQYVAFAIMGKYDFLQIDNPDLCTFLAEAGISVGQFVDDLIKTGLVTREGNRLVYISTKCSTCISEGKYYVADDYDGKLMAWAKERQSAAHPDKPVSILKIDPSIFADA